jgi:hypothetical protein
MSRTFTQPLRVAVVADCMEVHLVEDGLPTREEHREGHGRVVDRRDLVPALEVDVEDTLAGRSAEPNRASMTMISLPFTRYRSTFWPLSMHSTGPARAHRGSRPAPRGVTATSLLYVARSTRPVTHRACLDWKARTACRVAESKSEVLARVSPVQISRC